MKIFLSLIIFCGMAFCGIKIAEKKLLWNDELFTQIETIDRLNVLEILKGKFPEGNLSPLFYLGQKAVCQATKYKLPVQWQREFCIFEPRGQVLLRALPVFYMSLAVASIFLFLAHFFSTGFAFIGLAVTVSEFSVWAFLPEARPYSLWFLFCSWQCMILIWILHKEKGSSFWPWGLMAVNNLLLSFTIFFSAIPIIATSVVLFLRNRTRFLQHSFFITVLPLAVCGAYYFLAKRTYAALPQEPGGFILMIEKGFGLIFSGALLAQQSLLFTNVPPFWLVFMGLGIMVCAASFVVKATLLLGEEDTRVLRGLTLAFALMMGMALMVVMWFMGWQASGNFSVADRYFLFLTPCSIFVVMALTRVVWRAAQHDPWWRLMTVIVTGAMIVLTSLWTYINLLKWGPFWSL